MKSSKPHTSQEDDEDFEEDYTSKGTSIVKDSKNNDKAKVVRSKHSVTEQRRRSKINERFQMLRGLIPNGEQKRDTSSFLLEVIEYVQVLQEKVQKYEGSYRGWGTEASKLTPWRHNHWRVQSYLGHHPQPQSTVKNGPASASASDFSSNPSLIPNLQNTAAEIDAYRNLEQHHSELADILHQQNHEPTTVRIETPDDDDDAIETDDDQHHTIEGGTVSISSNYSHGLLTTLTKALQSSGLDLTEASISIQIDLGKRANPSLLPGLSTSKEVENQVSREDSDPLQKKLKS